MAYVICHFFSKYLSHDTEVSVVLPDEWKKLPEDGYPTLYLLHGRGDDSTSWLRNTSIERYAKEHQMAVIMPSAETSFYVDGIYGKRYFSYMTKELPEIMNRWFPLSKKPEKTYIAGLSMGGFGALKIGLTCPEAFAGIGVFSAGIRPDQVPDYEDSDTGNAILHEDIRCAFGDGPFQKDNIPQELVRSRLMEGKKLPWIIHYEGKQDFLYQMNYEFRIFAEGQDIEYVYEEWDGIHDWKFWDEAVQKLMYVISH